MYKPITNHNSLLLTKLTVFVSEFQEKLGNIRVNNELNSINKIFTLNLDERLPHHSTFALIFM
jgi:hypothetical protein